MILICPETRKFRILPTYGYTHAKIKNLDFNPEISEFIGDIGTILNDFQTWFYSTMIIWVKLIRLENPEIPGYQIYKNFYQTNIKALKTSMSSQILNTQQNRIVTQFKVQILSLEMVSAKTSILAPNLTKTQI